MEKCIHWPTTDPIFGLPCELATGFIVSRFIFTIQTGALDLITGDVIILSK